MLFKTIQFTKPDVILCLNGILPETEFFTKLSPIPIVCADGAAIKLCKKGVLPQHIIGDLDSITEEIEFWNHNKRIVIKKIQDQNSTDFEKCLDYIRHLKFLSPIICGFHGGELDHTLNNWSILMRYGRMMPLTVYELQRIAIPIYESVVIQTTKGEMISLLPQPAVCITTNGLEWNLQREELILGIREGARNRATKEHITLEIHSGNLLLFQEAALPYIPQISTYSKEIAF